jgi:adenylosuccinate synthase
MVNTSLIPQYKEYNGWKSSLEGIREFEDFPQSLQDYILDLQAYLAVPFTMISIGPERESLIIREKVSV